MTAVPSVPAPGTLRQGPAIRTCPLCESTCGLVLTFKDGKVVDTRGDEEDVFSKGYLCPKGATLALHHSDPDLLRAPVIKRDGEFVEVSWDEAFAEVQRLFVPLMDRLGRDAVAVYQGNPVAHTMSLTLYPPVVVRALKTKMLFTSTTTDSRPRDISSALVFGERFNCPIPDVDRTDYMLMIGANPAVSNGSLATAPNWRGRLKALTERGGTFVVVDPRRTKTVEIASEYLAIRPGTDALMLLAMLHVLFDEELVDLGLAADFAVGLEDVRKLTEEFTPEAVAIQTGLDPARIRTIARDFATAQAACAYGRMGSTTGPRGTVTTWLIDLLNLLTGNIDKPGGAMFTNPAARWASNVRGGPRYGKPVELHRFRSRVRGAGETLGELPVNTLAEEIDTPGEGQIRGLVTIAGNPVVSAPDAARLDAAMEGLEAMVSVDCYINETTRHADVILPPPSALERPHYDFAMMQYATRNVANYSPALLPVPPNQMHEWEVLCRLAAVLQGDPVDTDPRTFDDQLAVRIVRSLIQDPGSPIHGADQEEILAELEPRFGPERLLDLMLRVGPYGDAFGRASGTLCLDELLQHPHGMDFGPLVPMLPDALRTPDGMIQLAPVLLVKEAETYAAELDSQPHPGLLLIGRRSLRSNNSWGHNLPILVAGGDRCTLLMSPDDALDRALTDGERVRVYNNTGEVFVTLEISPEMRGGVVSLPHGWGHGAEGLGQRVARQHPGVNSNLLTDPHYSDPLTGTAALNGIPVEVVSAPAS